MRKFEFSDSRNIHLDIAGNQFSVLFSLGLCEELVKIGKKAAEYSKRIDNGDDQIKIAKDTVSLIKECLDKILGDGACQKIFLGRDENVYDCIEVLLFISEELEAYRAQKEKRQIETFKKLKEKAQKNESLVGQSS